VDPPISVKRNVTVPVGRLAMHAPHGIHEPPTPEGVFGGNPVDSSEKRGRTGTAGASPFTFPEPNGGIQARPGEIPETLGLSPRCSAGRSHKLLARDLARC
jgi:hypothetical protein